LEFIAAVSFSVLLLVDFNESFGYDLIPEQLASGVIKRGMLETPRFTDI